MILVVYWIGRIFQITLNLGSVVVTGLSIWFQFIAIVAAIIMDSDDNDITCNVAVAALQKKHMLTRIRFTTLLINTGT
ncbi:hypothetical protein BC941DRAFT_477194 [Chlamydoabsidia padenii]|nr:hypothetical protein BC941DRAFT_477194 [Chlamydoabsidia padenii]